MGSYQPIPWHLVSRSRITEDPVIVPGALPGLCTLLLMWPAWLLASAAVALWGPVLWAGCLLLLDRSSASWLDAAAGVSVLDSSNYSRSSILALAWFLLLLITLVWCHLRFSEWILFLCWLFFFYILFLKLFSLILFFCILNILLKHNFKIYF